MPTTLLKNPVDVNAASTSVGLTVSGTAAASTSGAGVKPANTVMVTGTPGQATTGTGVAAGDGADVVIEAGDGGAAVTGSTRGSGGSIYLNPGDAGGGAGTGGATGNVLIATTGGRVGIGTAEPNSVLEMVAVGNGRTFTSTQVAGSGVAATFRVRKAGTNMTAVTNGHRVGDFTYSGYDGTNFVVGARMIAVVDGTVAAGSVPTAITFSTGNSQLDTDSGDDEDPNALTENVRISSNGNVGIGTDAPGSRLHVGGGVQVGAPSGGDMGTGTVNVASGFFVNGSSLIDQLAEARQLIADLAARADRLEAEVVRLGGKAR